MLRYFELLDHIGLADDGTPEPIREVGISVATPTMVEGEVVALASTVRLHALPGTRVVKTNDPRIAGALLETGHYREVDKPAAEEARAEAQKSKED